MMWYQRQKFHGYWWWRIRSLCSTGRWAWPSYEKCGDVVRAGLIHQPRGQPPALGAGWVRPMSTGRWMVGSTPTGNWGVDPWPHTRPGCFPSDPKRLGQPNPWRGAEVTASWALGEPHWESWQAVLVLLVVFCRATSPFGPCLSHPLVKVDESFKILFLLLPSCPQIAGRVLYTYFFVSFCSWCSCFQTSGLKFSFLVA